LKLRHLDLFSGIGGFSLGLERTGGFQTVGFCDNDKKTHLVLKKHWPNVPIYDDVSTLKGSDLGTVEIITGGFPCQDLSVAGKGAGLEGARSGLWWQFHRLIKEAQPRWVIAENVSALRSRGLDQVLRSLDQIGYDAEWHCVPASAVGAPHQRDRIWILAYPRHRGGRHFGIAQEGHNTQRQRTTDSDSIGGPGGQSASVAYSDSGLEANGGECKNVAGKGFSGSTEQGRGSADDRERCFRGAGSSSKNVVAYTGGEGLERLGIRTVSTESQESMPASCGCVVRKISVSDFWKVEPELGRVADGIPNRMDRLKQLGNSLVPQIPEMIGYAILQQERNQ
jgi:DNA (cytosine-5)-methyltransferase 1